jgi:hypothetical protein
MLRVQVMLEPFGEKALARVLSEITIANVTPGGSGRMSSDYAWRIRSLDRSKQTMAYGCLVDSYNSTAIDLLWEVLDEWKSGRELPIDNHGHPVSIIRDHEAFWKHVDDDVEVL